MSEENLKSVLDKNLQNLMTLCTQGVYPEAFVGSPVIDSEYKVEAPLVCHQLVCGPQFQVLSFFMMDLGNILKAGQELFPKMIRSESLQMVVSANTEVLNAVSSRINSLVEKIKGKTETRITPPLVMNHSGENLIHLNPEDIIAWNFKSKTLEYNFLISLQEF